jgi:hypothetical protein
MQNPRHMPCFAPASKSFQTCPLERSPHRLGLATNLLSLSAGIVARIIAGRARQAERSPKRGMLKI